LARQHAIEGRPKYIEFARPTHDRSMPIPALDCRIAHADLILPLIPSTRTVDNHFQ
jgi:hypothetical protein